MKKKTVKSLKKKADKVMSLYIRQRDASKGCVTCGKLLPWKEMDAGHWMGRGCGATRYDEHNLAGQCKGCNRFGKVGQVAEKFRRALIERYGEEEVERVYRTSKQTHRFTIQELEDIIAKYSPVD